MALRPRNTWHRTNGKWTCSLGHRGLRVRLFQKRSDGPFYRAVWIPGGGRDQKPLQTADREEAERLGKQLLAELLVQTERERPKTATDTPVRIADLWHRYSRECDEFLANTPETRVEKANRAGRFIEFFGADFDVRTMSPADWSRFVRARKSGRFTNGKRQSPGGVVTIHVDLTLLRTMCAWARTVRTSDNKRWLADDPLAGVKSERQKNPKRPVTSWDRYTRTARRRVRFRTPPTPQLLARDGSSSSICSWLRKPQANESARSSS